jgi:hypothetical protein
MITLQLVEYTVETPDLPRARRKTFSGLTGNSTEQPGQSWQKLVFTIFHLSTTVPLGAINRVGGMVPLPAADDQGAVAESDSGGGESVLASLYLPRTGGAYLTR